MKLFIAIIPQDYSSADAHAFASLEEAQEFIEENAIRGDTHYCSIHEQDCPCTPNP